MPHILFDGDIRKHPALRSLFWQWGVTVGRVPVGERDGARVTVEDCDAVVQLRGTTDSSALISHAMPDGAGTEGVAAPAAAPLLVIGPGRDREGAWITIPDPGPGGALLRSALENCRNRARELRGDPVSGRDQDRFRDFLGHELRTPLTAIRTALNVIRDGKDLVAGPERMLAIALRNLDRLTETVEWSRELATIAESSLTAELRPVGLAELGEFLPDRIQVDAKAAEAADEVLTDPALLALLVSQMERVIFYAGPGCRPEGRLDWDARTREVRLRVAAGSHEGTPSIPRAGYVDGEGQPARIEELVRMLVSPNLLQILGVKLRTRGGPSGAPELFLLLPAGAGHLNPPAEPQPTA